MNRSSDPVTWENLFSWWNVCGWGPRIALRIQRLELPADRFGPAEIARWKYLLDGFEREEPGLNTSGLEHTAMTLARAKTPEAYAAAWIAAWCVEKLGRNGRSPCLWTGGSHDLIQAISRCTRPLISGDWHWAVTQTLPASFDGFHNENGHYVPPESYHDVVEAVSACAAMTAGLFEVVYYRHPRLDEIERMDRERDER